MMFFIIKFLVLFLKGRFKGKFFWYVFFIFLPPFSFSSVSERCQKEGFYSEKLSLRGEGHKVPRGFRSSVMDLKTRAEESLGRTLNQEEITAIENANDIYQIKIDGKALPLTLLSKLERSSISMGNHILKRAGFLDKEIGDLRQSQVVGLPYNLGDTLLFDQNLRKINRTEEESWFIYQEGKQIVIGQIMKEISEHKFLANILDPKTRRIQNETIELDTNGAIVSKGEDIVYPQARSTDVIKPVFSALKSGKKILTLEEMDLFKEYPAKPSGYDPVWTKGWYEVYELLEVGKNLREKNINPHKTHIEYFARDIDKHIEHVRKGVLSIVDRDVKKAFLAQLEVIESSAKEVIREKAVSYYYWLAFNRRLSQVNTIQEGGVMGVGGLSGKGVEQAFPMLIVLPVIAENGILGIMTINRIFPYRIYPIGLPKGPKKVEGQRMSASQFYDHDMLHAELDLSLSYNQKDRLLFHNRFLKFVENLPPEKRKNVELAYFILTHEINRDFLSFPVEDGNQILENLLMSILSRQYRKNRAVYPFINQQVSEEHIGRVTDDFMEMFNQIKNQ